MTCCLSPSNTLEEHFNATAGCRVTLKLKGFDGSGAVMVHVRYAGAEVTSDPPQFEIVAGEEMLVVLAEASRQGTRMQLLESCEGSAEQVLDEFDHDAMNPARAYVIRGSSVVASAIIRAT